jgi:hypothetical protein
MESDQCIHEIERDVEQKKMEKNDPPMQTHHYDSLRRLPRRLRLPLRLRGRVRG